MIELKYEANKIVYLNDKITDLELDLADKRTKLKTLCEKYQDQWLKVLSQMLDSTGRTWCTSCNQLIYKEKATERYELYAKSDNYSPIFAHTSTKHRACPTCAPQLSSPKEAKKFHAAFEKDYTKHIMDSKVRAQAAELFDMPPFQPTKVEH